jgi:hypothetical protein
MASPRELAAAPLAAAGAAGARRSCGVLPPSRGHRRVGLNCLDVEQGPASLPRLAGRQLGHHRLAAAAVWRMKKQTRRPDQSNFASRRWRHSSMGQGAEVHAGPRCPAPRSATKDALSTLLWPIPVCTAWLEGQLWFHATMLKAGASSSGRARRCRHLRSVPHPFSQHINCCRGCPSGHAQGLPDLTRTLTAS